MLEFLLLLSVGLATGAVGSLVGAGGGFLLVPVLLLFYPGDVAAHITSISLVVVFFTAFSGSITYGWMRRIDYRAGLAFALAGIPTTMLGAHLSSYVPRRYFDPGVALLLVGVALYLLFNPKDHSAGAGSAAQGTQGQGRVLRLGCVLTSYIGLVSGLAGVGGGIVQVPMLVKMLRFSPHAATATSLFSLSIMAFAGTLVHVAEGRLDERGAAALYLAMGVLMGAQLGAKLSTLLRGTALLRVLAAILAFVGARLLWNSLGL